MVPFERSHRKYVLLCVSRQLRLQTKEASKGRWRTKHPGRRATLKEDSGPLTVGSGPPCPAGALPAGFGKEPLRGKGTHGGRCHPVAVLGCTQRRGPCGRKPHVSEWVRESTTVVPQGHPCPNPGTCQCITSCGKRELQV